MNYQDVLAAIKKNGFKHSHDGWYHTNNNNAVLSACVAGQGAINLGIDDNSMFGVLASVKVTPEQIKSFPKAVLMRLPYDYRSGQHTFSLYDLIVYLNDSLKLSYDRIVKIVEPLFPDTEVTTPIKYIEWNIAPSAYKKK